MDLQVNVAGLQLKNPVLTASGTFGYASEFEPFFDVSRLGGVIVKGISLQPRPGNPPPRVVETACGMLNAIGLENVGVERFATEKMGYLRQLDTRVVVNILGDSVEEYGQLAERVDALAGVDAIEVNISCPNVKKGGVAFGTVARMAQEVTERVRRATRLPLIVKLSPNVTDIVEMARAVEAGGADGVSLINTLLGMAIDIQKKRPKLANVVGGLSGPAIKPVALRMVWQVARAVQIPVVGIGGITNANDAIEFLLAGATAIQVGTANFINPCTGPEIIDGLTAYLQRHNHRSVREIIGGLQID